MIQGQMEDIAAEGASLGFDQLRRLHALKTGALIEASAEIGAILGGGSERQVQLLKGYAADLGLAFQVQDDILGVWGDPKVTGKAAGNDILRRKKSLPLLYALNHGQTAPRLRALMADEITPDQLPQVLALLEQAGAREYAEAIVARQYEVGLRALEEALGERATDSALYELANSLLGRRS
jgi:geranylgeranyl diphosphate synthase type I